MRNIILAGGGWNGKVEENLSRKHAGRRNRCLAQQADVWVVVEMDKGGRQGDLVCSSI